MKVIVCVRSALAPGERAALALAAGLGGDVKVLALAAGDAGCDAALRACLAAGAGYVARLEGDALASADFHTLGRALAAAVRHLGGDLVLTGERSIDEGLGAITGSLAHHLDARQVARIEALAADAETQPASESDRTAGAAAVTVIVRGGGLKRRLRVPLPAVLSVSDRVMSPSLPTPSSVPSVSPVEREIRVLSLTDVGLDPGLIRRRDVLLGTLELAPRPATVTGSADAFARALRPPSTY